MAISSVGVNAASLWRRFFASLLDSILLILTLGVGWLIWFFFTAQKGQSPGKSLLGLRCLKIDGSLPTAGAMWLRDVVIKALLWGLFSPLSLVAYLWAFFDKDKQALHDKMVNTVVVRMPGTNVVLSSQPAQPATTTSLRQGADAEEELRRLARLRDEGLLTPEEFEERRKAVVEHL